MLTQLSIDHRRTSKCKKIVILLQQTRENYINILRLDIKSKLLDFSTICNNIMEIEINTIICDGRVRMKTRVWTNMQKDLKTGGTSKRNLIKLFLDFLD